MKDYFYTLGYLRANLRWRLYLWVFLAMVAILLEGVSIGLFVPIVTGAESDSPLNRLLHTIFEMANLEYTLTLALVAIGSVYTARTALVVLQENYVAGLISGLLADVRNRVVGQILDVDYQYFVRKGVGYFSNAVTHEFANFAQAFRYATLALAGLGFAGVYGLLAVAVNPQISLLVVAAGVPTFFALRFVLRKTRRASVSQTEANGRLQSLLLQMLGAFRYFRVTGETAGISTVINDTVDRQSRLLHFQRRMESYASNGIDLLSVLLIVGLLWFYVDVRGTHLIELAFVLLLLRRAATFGRTTQRWFQRFQEFSGSVRLHRELDRSLRANQVPKNDSLIDPNPDGQIRLDLVSFGYEDGSNVLSDVSMVIEPRTTVGIVGASGVGKTTLVTLLTGILKPTSGQISINGIPYDQLDLRRLRRSIGYVGQDTTVFNDTLRNNMLLWNSQRCPGRTTDLPDVADSVGLTSFIQGLPDGYATVLGDNGAKLSGGQRQRVAIAREILRNPRIFIIDEGTSALDSESEILVKEAIGCLAPGTTRVLIAHRLSTVRDCDVIYVVDSGHIVERGTYSELLAAGGLFTRMVDRQAAGGVR